MAYPKEKPAKNASNLLGQKFERWTVLEQAETRQVGKSKRDRRTFWLCRCECGNEKEVDRSSLVNGYSKSCGCLHKERAREHAISGKLGGWNKLPKGEAAFNRLLDGYKRGAKERKLSFLISKEEFRNFVTDKCFYCGSEPSSITNSKNLNGDFIYNGIDRTDNKKGYEVKNCVTCCKECNFFKKTKSKEEFLNLVKRIYENVYSDSG